MPGCDSLCLRAALHCFSCSHCLRVIWDGDTLYCLQVWATGYRIQQSDGSRLREQSNFNKILVQSYFASLVSKIINQHQTQNHTLYLSTYLMCRVSIWIILQDAGLGNNQINNRIYSNSFVKLNSYDEVLILSKEHCSFCHVCLENMASLPANVLIFLRFCSKLRNCLHSHILPLALISSATVWTTSVGSQKLLCTLVRLLLPCNCSLSQTVKKTLLSKFTNQQNQSYSSSNELFTASFWCVWFKSGRPICQPVLGAILLSRFFFFFF